MNKVMGLRLRVGVVVGSATAVVVSALATASPAASALGGSQGVNPQLPATPSQVTVAGRGPYANVKVTVNQTQSLVNQAISVSWTGAQPTTSGDNNKSFNGQVFGNFFAIFQCWGNPTDMASSVDPGPPPTQCEVGASAPSNKNYPVDQSFTTPFNASSRILDDSSSAPTAAQDQQAGGMVDPVSGAVEMPFHSVDGSAVNTSEDRPALTVPPDQPAPPFWNPNMPFSINDTNEIDYAHTYPGGTGLELFQVDTGQEASGLGCGQHSEPGPGGSSVIPQCWLVLVPQPTTATSPLNPVVWQNRIAIPLQFSPVDSPCSINSVARSVEGGQMASLAVHSWQPTLCTTPGDPPYNYTTLSDDQARQDLSSSGAGGGTLSVVSIPTTPSSDSAVWAPLTLSSVVIGFNVSRVSGFGPDGQPYPDQIPIQGSRVASINLTPRLVAKLLTQSYGAEFVGMPPDNPERGYNWLYNPTATDPTGKPHQNPGSLVDDPDFKQFNPEFAELYTPYGVTASQLIVQLGSADANLVLWNWALSDPEAAAWLGGSPDPWGMLVNPIYSTNPQLNPTGAAFGTPLPNRFPKSDPYCEVNSNAPPLSNGQPPDPPCILNWAPYALNMTFAAQEAGSSNIGSRTTIPTNFFGITASNYWQLDGPERTGEQFMLSVTDSPSAVRYGLQEASLSAAGDDRPNRPFVAPTFTPNSNSLLAGLQSMAPNPLVPNTLIPNVASTANGAYPLTLLSYAAAVPGTLDATARHDYAAFINYAAGPGQTPGLGFGQLPPGYVPLPESLKAQARAAAQALLTAPTQDTPSTGGTSSPHTTAAKALTQPVSQAVGGSAGAVPSSTTTPSTILPTTAPSATPTGSTVPKSTQRLQRTPKTGVGFVRFSLPIGAAAGILAALTAPLTIERRRREDPADPKN